MKKKIAAFVLLGSILIATACSWTAIQPIVLNKYGDTAPPEQTNSQIELEHQEIICIEPLTTLAYPAWGPDMLPLRSDYFIPPEGGYAEVINLPDSIHVASEMYFQGDSTLWIESSSMGALRYDLQTNTLEEVDILDGWGDSNYNLFQGPNDEIWGFNISQIEYNDNSPLLRKYDVNANRFVTVQDKQGILTDANYFVISKPVVVEGEVIWLLLKKDNGVVLVSFDLNTKIAEERATISSDSYSVSQITIGPDGNLWMVDRGRGSLLFYSFETQELYPYEIPRYGDFPDYPHGISSEEWRFAILYVDRQNHMWIGDYGWLKFSEEGTSWYRVIRSPVFIDSYQTEVSYYIWSSPNEIYHSTKNEYWFSSSAGVILLDPEQAQWCLISTIPGAFTEDPSGNMWVAIFDKIYKYEK